MANPNTEAIDVMNTPDAQEAKPVANKDMSKVYHEVIDNTLDEEVNTPNLATNDRYKSGTLSNNYLFTQYNRLTDIYGITNMPTFIVFSNHLRLFAYKVSGVESDYGRNLISKGSSAKGRYQFIDDTASRIGQKVKNTSNMGVNMSHNPLEWNKDEEDLAFFANLFSAKGSDTYMLRVSKGDINAMSQVFKKFHHTKPNIALSDRMKKYGL